VWVASKTTLLRTLAGRHLHKESSAKLFGRSCYYDTTLNTQRAYLSSTWGQRTVAFSGFGYAAAWVSSSTRLAHAHRVAYICSQYHQADVAASEIMATAQKRYQERRDLLRKVLEVDLDWRMHAVG